MKKYLLLTFDLEEFNLPLEIDEKIGYNEMFSISYKGLLEVLKILDKFNIKATFFTTLAFGQRFPKMINKIVNKGNEIALHHSLNSGEFMNSILNEKRKLEDIIGIKILGIRMHKLKVPPFKLLKKLGFKYDSSIHPTIIPGRYNYLPYPTGLYITEGILEISISVTPLLRLPFSFLWFRNFGLSYTKFCTLFSTLNREFINVYYHPWEFTNIDKFPLPFYIKRNCGKNMIIKMKKYINWHLNKNFKPITICEFIKN